jgi:hypothetical protein
MKKVRSSIWDVQILHGWITKAVQMEVNSKVFQSKHSCFLPGEFEVVQEEVV